MKRIGIDARLYSQTGVGVYVRNLLYNLQKINNSSIDFYIYFMKEEYEKVKFESKHFIKRLANFPWHSLSEQIDFPTTLKHDDLDLMHFTYFSYPIIYKRPFIATIHDVTPLLFKTGKASTKNRLIYEFKHKIFQYIISNQVKKAKLIITPTKTVKNQIINIYGIKYSHKITSIYEGVDYQLAKTVENKELKKKFIKPFFIYVGNFYPHKNVETLVKAFSAIKNDYQLILLGPKDYFSTRLLQCIKTLKCQENIILFLNPSKQDLVFFYKNAKALIHPSLSEGFGLPIIEAMQFNLPIIASNILVFKELLNDQGLFFNPNDFNDIKNTIEYFVKNKPKFSYSESIKKYSFEQMTKETYRLYLKNT